MRWLATLGHWLWTPSHYWPIWLLVFVLGIFGAREADALATGRPQDTFSQWVWNALKIHPHEAMAQWTFVDFAFFALYCAVFIWLAKHFFWHNFT